jgi:hypothetical protein
MGHGIRAHRPTIVNHLQCPIVFVRGLPVYQHLVCKPTVVPACNFIRAVLRMQDMREEAAGNQCHGDPDWMGEYGHIVLIRLGCKFQIARRAGISAAQFVVHIEHIFNTHADELVQFVNESRVSARPILHPALQSPVEPAFTRTFLTYLHVCILVLSNPVLHIIGVTCPPALVKPAVRIEHLGV